jgi:hypothetical protein
MSRWVALACVIAGIVFAYFVIGHGHFTASVIVAIAAIGLVIGAFSRRAK